MAYGVGVADWQENPVAWLKTRRGKTTADFINLGVPLGEGDCAARVVVGHLVRLMRGPDL